MREPKSLVDEFLRSHYGITWKDIAAKGRATLLADLEQVSCNLCGDNDSLPIADRDKYGLTLSTVICKRCGLIYLNPRPTIERYRRFYEAGGEGGSFYHRKADLNLVEDLLKFYFGSEFVMDEERRGALTNFMTANNVSDDGGDHAAAKDANKLPGFGRNDDFSSHGNREPIDYYAEHIYNEIKDWVPRGGKVFEPGASWGKMLQPWNELHGCEATGVEPKKAAVRAAKERLGLDLLQGFSNDPRIGENCYDLILNTRTINHMLDPLGDLRYAWRWLKPRGILFVDIQDAVEQSRHGSFERKVVEIDHPYMFSLRTLSAMVQRAGFKIERAQIQDRNELRTGRPRPDQIRIVARKTTEPVIVDWPNPLAELGTLFTAQIAWERARAAKEQVKHLAVQKKETKTALPRSVRATGGLRHSGAKRTAVAVLERFGIKLR